MVHRYELAQRVSQGCYSCDVDAEVQHAVKRIAIVAASETLHAGAKKAAKYRVHPGSLRQFGIELPVAVFKRWRGRAMEDQLTVGNLRV